MRYKDNRRFIVKHLPTGGEDGQPTWGVVDRQYGSLVWEAGYTQAGARAACHTYNYRSDPRYAQRAIRPHRRRQPAPTRGV